MSPKISLCPSYVDVKVFLMSFDPHDFQKFSVCRQLPLIGLLLEGRVHLEFQVFHSQNHQIPFKVFLGLLELMQPHVLKQFKILRPILTLYMQLFEVFETKSLMHAVF